MQRALTDFFAVRPPTKAAATATAAMQVAAAGTSAPSSRPPPPPPPASTSTSTSTSPASPSRASSAALLPPPPPPPDAALMERAKREAAEVDRAKRARESGLGPSFAVDAEASGAGGLPASDAATKPATPTGATPAGAPGDGPLAAQIARLSGPWRDVLAREAAKPAGKLLLKHVESRCSQTTVYPPVECVFEALALCPFDSVRAVILGQDPYHGPGQAHGLAFSVRRGVDIPPSLRNVFKEAGVSSPRHGCLESWSKQGVLLLNAVLTVERGAPQSHAKRGWEAVTDALIRAVSERRSHVCFMLWGQPAQLKGALVNRSKHLVLCSSHPSPLGATKTDAPFVGSRHFDKCNAYLKQHGLGEIDWRSGFA